MMMSKTAEFCTLSKAAATAKTLSMRDLAKDSTRTDAMIVDSQFGVFDLTRQLMTLQDFESLVNLAHAREVPSKVAKMFNGDAINETEKRAVLHVALRSKESDVINVDGVNVVPAVHKVLGQMKVFSDEIRDGKRLGYTGKILKNVICIGIGGSYLGPEFVFESLKTNTKAKQLAEGRTTKFLANVDPIDSVRALEGLNAEETLVIVISKTFTTAETMLNARTVRSWLVEKLGTEKAVANHVVAVSTNLQLTQEFGIAPENVFAFWDWVGGRYSVTSAVGVLPLMLQYSYPVVADFLRGARDMDTHFRDTPVEKNLPVLAGLISHWNTVFMNFNTVAILPYCQALTRFAAHVQQLNMESNGKGVTLDGNFVDYPTGPIIFGEPGTNGQHSFYQLMHQGHIVPAEFIGFAKSQQPIDKKGEVVTNHDELMSNFFAQPDALAFGKTAAEVKAEGVPESLVTHKSFSGNRPSTVLMMPVNDAYYTGALLSLYEHRTAVEGFLLGINSFDQWGVELGKVLAKRIRNHFAAERAGKTDSVSDLPLATQTLLAKYKSMK